MMILTSQTKAKMVTKRMLMVRHTDLMLLVMIRDMTEGKCAATKTRVSGGCPRMKSVSSLTGIKWQWSGKRYSSASWIGPKVQYGRAGICCKKEERLLPSHDHAHLSVLL